VKTRCGQKRGWLLFFAATLRRTLLANASLRISAAP
jgi:hypothetical protein